MTKRARTTQAQVRRMIKAALSAGLRVTKIMRKPDGTITVETTPLVPSLHQDSLEGIDDVVL